MSRLSLGSGDFGYVVVLTVVMTLAGTVDKYAFENEMTNRRMGHCDPRSLSFAQRFLSCFVKIKGNFCSSDLQGSEKTLVGLFYFFVDYIKPMAFVPFVP